MTGAYGRASRAVGVEGWLSDVVAKLQLESIGECSLGVDASPLVSIIVPTYNHEGYIADCLEAIARQSTTFPFEILVGDDDSTDSTREVCRRSVKKFPEKIRLFEHRTVNRLEVAGVRTGRFNLIYLFSKARGRYIAWCDGDDLWTDPDKLSAQVACLKDRPDAVLCFSDVDAVDVESGAISPWLTPGLRCDRSVEDLAAGKLVPTQSVMFRNVFDQAEIPESFFRTLNGDLYLFAWMSRFGRGAYVPSLAPCIYRRHSTGIWTGQSALSQSKHHLSSFRNMRDLELSPSQRRSLERRISEEMTKSIAHSVRAMNPGEFFRTVGAGLVRLLAHPSHVGPSLAALLRAVRRRIR